MENNQYYVPHMEWEAITFPLKITQISFEEITYASISNAEILIWRKDNYVLEGILTGSTRSPEELDQSNFIGKGNIVKGGIMAGIDAIGNIVQIHDCMIDSIRMNSWQISEKGYEFEGSLIFDKVTIKSALHGNERIRLDWFVCAKTSADFERSTFRNLKLPGKKMREGTDEFNKSMGSVPGSSWSKDHILVDLPQEKCIIAEVPAIFLPENVQGICFEFRGKLAAELDDPLLNNLKNFASFLLGTQLHHIGYSIVEGGSLKEAFLYSPTNLKVLLPVTAMPPIRFNRKYEWGNIAWLINKLLPQYLQLQETLHLNAVLHRYWTAKRTPLGSNLPILANAIEILAANYLKMTGKFNFEIIPDNEYHQLIKEEIRSIENKITNTEGYASILNKIKTANKKVPSEKITFFFSLLGISTGKSEKAAINLRNKMAHSTRDYKDDNIMHNDLILTRVYEVLFNRVMLKLLGYDGYYQDYSVTGTPSRHIDTKAGAE